MKDSEFNRILNLGCGNHFHEAWVNVDFSSTSASVLKHDIRNRLPFDDASFDAVYSAHSLEHLCKSNALSFLVECKRVLRPGGVLRIVVPDLENACRSYLRELELTREEKKNIYRLEWSVVELIDQIGRQSSGGDMIGIIRDPHPSAKKLIVERLGEIEYSNLSEPLTANNSNQKVNSGTRNSFINSVKHTKNKIRHFTKNKCNNVGLFLLERFGDSSVKEALSIGLFLQSGENHRWMYDDVQLSYFLAHAGFTDPVRCSYNDSLIQNFSDYELDGIQNNERKPHSLYMEAVA